MRRNSRKVENFLEFFTRIFRFWCEWVDFLQHMLFFLQEMDMEMEDELDFSAKSDELEIHTIEDKVQKFFDIRVEQRDNF